MPKYLVTAYHIYSTSVEVDADNMEQASAIGLEMSREVSPNEMDYCDSNGTMVTPFNEDGETLNYSEMRDF